jgi:hypothetical protein
MRAIAVCIGVLAVLIGLVIVLFASGDSPKTALSPGESVLSPSFAKGVGFPSTYQAAKKGAVSGEKGCSSSVGAVYEDRAGKTALVSDLLSCKSAASAGAALATLHKEVKDDAAISVPRALGSSAFATASEAPEYLVAWQVDSRVAITAIDVNVRGSSNASKTAPAVPITRSQKATLANAVLEQNSLYH